MTQSAHPPTPESLLEHREWLRAIARNLVANEGQVDEVEQRTWLVVLRNRRPVHSVRAWLRRVVRSAAVDEHRTDTRRQRREEESARPEALPPTDHLAAQADAQRVVAKSVTALPEPYRTTVLLRYFEGLSIAEVAERMGSPRKTVQTRLTRAHALLRDALDREFGDRRAWCFVLLPLAGTRWRIPFGTFSTGAALMAGKAKAVAAVTLLALICGAWWLSRSTASQDETLAIVPTVPAAADAPRRSVVVEPSVVAAAPGSSVGVEMVDVAARPVTQARLTLHAEGPTASESETDPLFLGVAAAERVVTSAAPLVTTARADGTARFEQVPDGSWRLRIDATGYATHEERIAVAGAAARRRVVLHPACVLVGTVFRADGAPAADAVVDVGGRRATAAADGRYLFDALAPGSFDVRVEFAGKVQDVGAVAVPEVGHLDLRLRGGCALRGRVVDDETGAPIAGARVSFRGTVYADLPRMLGYASRALTDADGRFGWEDLPSGTPNFLRVEQEGYVESRGEPGWRPAGAHLMPNLPVTCEVRMTRGALVRGRVVTESSAPVAGAVVDVWTRNHLLAPYAISAPAITSMDGEFRMLAQPGAGLVRVRAVGAVQRGFPKEPWSALRDGLVPPDCAVVVAAGSETVLEITMDPAPSGAGTGALGGTISREDGRPLDQVRVQLVPQDSVGAGPVRTPVDAHGTFRFEGLAAATYVLRAVAAGCAPARLDGLVVSQDAPLDGVTVVLAPEQSIAGRVTDESGVPVAGAEISAAASPWERAGPAVSVSAADGTFVVRRLSAGTWHLDARAEGFVRRSVDATAGTSDVHVRLERGLTISGTTVDAETGLPVAGVPLHASFASGRTDANRNVLYREVASDAEGRFVLGGLAPDAYRVAVGPMQQVHPWGAGDLVLTFVEDVAAGTTDVRVPVRSGFSITGRVVDERGRPATGGVVDALEPASAQESRRRVLRRARVAGDGSFRIPGLEPGSYDLTAGPSHAAPGPVLFPAAQAGATDVVVRLGEPAVIAGRLVLEDGTPFSSRNGHLEFRSVGPDGKQTSRPAESAWDSAGRFRSGALEPDRVYDVVFSMNPEYLGAVVRGVRPGGMDLEVVVQRGGSITGRVLDVEGRPVPEGVFVSANATDADGTGRLLRLPGDSSFARVGADGTFALRALGERTYEISAGGDPSEFLSGSHPARLRPGATGIEIRLRRGATLSGRLVDSRGVPLRAGFVQVERHGDLVPLDEQGRFTIRALEPGSRPVFVQIGDRVVSLGEVAIPGEGADLVVPDR